MAHFILVHGAWHGGWCWEEIVPRLAALGHTVEAPDLPGMEPGASGDDPASLDDWAEFIADKARAAQAPVILAGHSRGGIVISRAAELAPEAISHLVYVTAVLTLPGDTGIDAVRRGQAPGGNPSRRGIELAPHGRTTRFTDPEEARDMFYGSCSARQVEAAFARLAPEPASAMVTPLALTAERYGRLPRTYVECLQDQALTIAVQRGMNSLQPCAIVTMDTDHSPFYSAPDELTAILDGVARAS